MPGRTPANERPRGSDHALQAVDQSGSGLGELTSADWALSQKIARDLTFPADGLLLRELHHAETKLAEHYRAVAERQVADHDTYYPCHTLAAQCDQHAERLRFWAGHLGQGSVCRIARKPSRPRVMPCGTSPPSSSGAAGSRLKLLHDVRELYVQAETVNIHWIMLGQLAHALRDPDLLSSMPAERRVGRSGRVTKARQGGCLRYPRSRNQADSLFRLASRPRGSTLCCPPGLLRC